MGKVILVTEGDTPLGAALVQLFCAQGYSVATTTPAGEETAAQAARPEAGSPFVVAWNRRSPLSARNVVLSTLNAFDALEEVLILEAPCSSANVLHEAASAEIERSFDDAKGPVFLAREILGHFNRQKRGIFALVSFPSAGSETSVQAAMREGFRGFASSLMASYGAAGRLEPRSGENGVFPHGNGTMILNGFQSSGAGVEEFAAFIGRTLEEKARKISGHWFLCQPRGGIFPGVLPARKS